MHQHGFSLAQVFTSSPVLSVGAALVSVSLKLLSEVVDGPSPSKRQPPVLIVSPPPPATRTTPLPPTPTSTASMVEDPTSISVVLICVVAATVLAAASGIMGMQKIVYGGSPDSWPTPPPPPRRNGGGGSQSQRGLGWHEGEEEGEEEEEEEDGDPSGEGPPPPPPDPPAKVDEPEKLPRWRFPLWLILLIVVVMGARRLVRSYIRGLARRMTVKATDPDPDAFTPDPQALTPPPQCPRPFLTPSATPPPPPPQPQPQPSPAVSPSARDLPRRAITPPHTTLAALSAALSTAVRLLAAVADLPYHAASALLAAWHALPLPRGAIDVLALCVVLRFWAVVRREAVVDMVPVHVREEDTLIAIARAKGAKGKGEPPRRDGDGDGEGRPPRPAAAPAAVPAPAAPTVRTPYPPAKGNAPAVRIPEIEDGAAPSGANQKENNDGRQPPHASPPAAPTVQASGRSPRPNKVKTPPHPAQEPVRVHVHATPRTTPASSSVFDMYHPAPDPGCQRSARDASLEVHGREDNSSREFLESVVDESVDDRKRRTGPNTPGPRPRRQNSNAPPPRSDPSRSSPPRRSRSRPSPPRAPAPAPAPAPAYSDVYAMYGPRAGPAPVAQDSIEGASLDVHGREGCDSREVDVDVDVSLAVDARRSARTPAHMSIYDMYAPRAGPALPAQDSIEGASLDVQGREVWDSRDVDVSLEEAVDVLPPSRRQHVPSITVTAPPRTSGTPRGSATGRRSPPPTAPPAFAPPSPPPPPHPHIPSVTSTAPPRSSSLPRGSATGRRSPPPTAPPSFAPPPAPAPAPRSRPSLDEKRRRVLPETRPPVHEVQGPARRLSIAGRSEQGSHSPAGRRDLGTTLGRREPGPPARATPVTRMRPPSLPAGSGIPRSSGTARRPAASSTAPPAPPRPPPSPAGPPPAAAAPTRAPTTPAPRRRDPVLPIASSSPRRTKALPEDASVAWASSSEPSITITPANLVFSEPSLPLSDGTFDNAPLVDGTLPPTDSESTVDSEHTVPGPQVVVPSSPPFEASFAVAGWESRLVDGSFPAGVDGSSVWSWMEDVEARRRLRESAPALRLVTDSGFELSVDVDPLEF